MHTTQQWNTYFTPLKKFLRISREIPEILVEKDQKINKSPVFVYNLFNVHLQYVFGKQKPKLIILMVNSTSLKIAFPDRGW